MESSFSLKPQGLTLTTRAPFSSPISLRHIGFLRSDYIGGGAHNLRLPRKRWKKMRTRHHSHYRNLLFRASLDSQRTAMVAASVAAFSVFYATYSGKIIDVKEMSGKLTLALSEQIRKMVSWILRDGSLTGLRKVDSVERGKDLIKEGKCSHEEVRTMDADIMDGSVNFRGELCGNASQSVSLEAASSVHSLKISTVPFLPQESVDPPILSESNNSVISEVSVAAVQNLSNFPSSGVYAPEETNNLVEVGVNNLGKEGVTSNSNLIFGNFARRDLYTIDESSLEHLDILEQMSSHASLQKNISYSSLRHNGLAQGSKLATSDVSSSTEKRKDASFGRQSQGYAFQLKNSRNRKDFRKKDKNISHQAGRKTLSESSNFKGKPITEKDGPTNDKFGPLNDEHDPVDNKQDPLWQLRVYNQLLREGRLNDCIGLLEDLEESGLLDMNKVYHARFFDVCKKQKAVREAFRFIRLIPNPTLSTFNMLMSVCASSQDSDGAFQVLQYVLDAGLKADCKLYTTLISTCAKSGKVDTMFKVFHEMVNAGVEPNVHTYSALIDGCAKAGQVAKAFGAYGILRSKNVKPDRVVFNALITACGQSGAVDRAFDVLAEMRGELHPIDPDHVTIGALMKACASAGQVSYVHKYLKNFCFLDGYQAREVYNMVDEYNIKGTAELYTIAVNSCSHHGGWEFACRVYDDMIRKDVAPDEMFISALIDVAGHAGKLDAAFEILQEAKAKGMRVGIISYSSLMGACCNARDWEKAIDLYEKIKGLNMKLTVPLMNALITALCDANQLQKAMEMLTEMKKIGLCPNTITYSILVVASEKNDDLEAGLVLISQAKEDGVVPNLVMCRCLLAMCLRRYQSASTLGEPLLSFSSGRAHLNNRWKSLALTVYRETITAGVVPTMDELSHVLGCLQLPHDVSVRKRLMENLGVDTDASKGANRYSLIAGFGEYDPRAFSLVEEATSLGIIPFVTLKESPIVVDARDFQVHVAEVYLLTVLKGLKHRMAAGAKLPNINILLPVEKTN